MGKLVLSVLVLLGAFLIWFTDPTVQQGRESAYWNRQAREAMALEREQQRLDAQMSIDALAVPVMQIVLLAVASTLVIGIPALLGVGAIAFFRRRAGLAYPDAAGRLPVRLADGEYQRIAAVALAAYHETQHERAHQSRAVPITYAPHTSVSEQSHADIQGAHSAADAALHPADNALPGLIDWTAVAHRPTVQSILLGLGPNSQPVTVPMKSLWHIGTAGATGTGKSNIARLIVAQLLYLGAQVSIADPKFTAFDAESGEDWRPIAARLHLAPASKADDIGDLLAWHDEELARRLELRQRGEKVGKPLFLYLDEWHVISEDVERANERMLRLSRIGRGLGMFLLTAAHSMLVKDGATFRDQFRTGYYLGGQKKSGSVLLDLPERDIDESQLGLGIAYLRSTATTPARTVRIPYASNEAVAGLLTDSQPTMERINGASTGHQRDDKRTHTASECGIPADTQKTPMDALILSLASKGTPISRMVIEVYGVDGGPKYKERAQHIMDVIAADLRKGGI
jgi:hypothetical protein